MKKKIISLLLTLALVLPLCPVFELPFLSTPVYSATSGNYTYTYTVSSGDATITDVETSISGSITIPSTLNGHRVTAIGKNAFLWCDELTSIEIPNRVTSIGDQAFMGCTSLTSIEIPNRVTSIGKGAFSGCISLASITIPFVGARKDGTSNTHFGYIFNATSYMEHDEYIPKSLKTVVITGGDVIANDAFYSCDNLTSITIPDSVTSIGEDAFLGCSSLDEVYISDLKAWCSIDFASIYSNPLYYTEKLYLNGSMVTELALPDDITSIKAIAFSCYDKLVSITVEEGNPVYHSQGNCLIETASKTLVVGCSTSVIPNDESVISIGNDAFSGCTSLTSIEIPDSITVIGRGAFYGCSKLASICIPFVGASKYGTSNTDFGYIFNATTNYKNYACVPDSLKTVVITGGSVIADSAFEDCSYLSSVTIPDSVTTIGNYAFFNCKALASVTIGNSVTSIGVQAFYNCRIPTITIPDSVTTIRKKAFQSCSLKSITIGKGVKTIGENAFYKCSSLDEVYISDLKAWCDINFGADPFYSSKSLYLNGTLLTDLVIPAGVETISENVFKRCTSLQSITIPDSVNFIGNSAFSGCTSLTSVTIPDSVTTIGGSAFWNCTSLTSITIPDSVTTIGDYAFFDCNALTDIWYEGSEEDRAKISIDSYNTELTSATWHYNACIKNSAENKVHVYDNACDAICNLCEAERIPPHDYSIQDKDGTHHWIECSLCGTIDEPTRETHKYDNSCDTTCDSCEYTRTITHDYSTLVKDETRHWMKCSICGSVDEDSREAHVYDHDCDAICNVCHVERTAWALHSYDATKTCKHCNAPQYLTFRINAQGTEAELASCNTSATGDIIIPATYEGLPVTFIDYAAFQYCTGITSVVIPDSVTFMANSVFQACANLKSVTIGNGITSIDTEVFWGCSSLTDIDFGNSVKSIGWAAFRYCPALTSITIPDSVTAIGPYAFEDCTGLTELTIPDSVEYLGAYAFYNCTSLKSVTFGNNVTNFPQNLFSGCASLKEIHLTKSVTTIGENAFNSCTELRDIWYEGTESDRNHITRNSGNDAIVAATWHYVDNACDTTCNKCNSTRAAAAHVYSGDCDPDCNKCGMLRSAGAHTYDNTCDANCNVCGETRTISHTYNNACDTDCNVCGETRAISHTYDNACDTDCNVCNETRTASPHIYDHNCDTDCNVCGAERTVPDHVYDNACDATCNVCEAERTVPDHVYDNACDTTCNECGATRTVPDHVYSNACDTTCNVCEAERTVPDHVYDNACDTTCNVCAAERTVPDHVYDNACDATCNECDMVRAAPHVYDNIIDTTCNECSATRTLPYDAYGTTGACFWCLEGTKLTIAGNGKMGAYESNSTAPWGKDITEVVVEEGVTTLGNYAFYDCRKLEKAVIPSTVTDIGYSVFRNCRALTSLRIPAAVKTIGNNFIATCNALTSLEVETGNTTYHSQGNCIIRTADKTLTHGCSISVIPTDGSVTAIGDYAFYCCSGLTSLVIPKGVTTIGVYSFRSCPSIASITFTSDVSKIADSAFYGCSALANVWYEGTTLDKEAIDIETNNAPLSSATWHYVDGGCDSTCNECGAERQVPDHTYDDAKDLVCNECGFERPPYTPGDVDGVEGVTLDDAIYLLYHVNFSTTYPVNQPVDFNGDGREDLDDAIYLLYHVNFKDTYPLH